MAKADGHVLIHDRPSGLFAPAKYCAFVPVTSRAREMKGHPAMDMRTYVSLDESETRFDGAIARDHLARRLTMQIVPLADCAAETRQQFERWREGVEDSVRLHPRGSHVLLVPHGWD